MLSWREVTSGPNDQKLIASKRDLFTDIKFFSVFIRLLQIYFCYYLLYMLCNYGTDNSRWRNMAAFKNILLYKMTIPYEFKISDKDLILSFNSQLDEVLDKRIRRVIIHKEDVFVEDQLVPPNNTFFSKAKLDGKNITYSYNVSSMEIQLEIYDEEVDKIREYFKCNNNILKLSNILQNVLLVFSYLYNQSMAGEEFFVPFVNNYAPFVSRLLTSANNYNDNDVIISVSYQLEKIKNGKIIDIKSAQKFIWKYYFNRAKNAYNLYENLDVILYCSISFESYLTYLIDENSLRDKFDSYKRTKRNVDFNKKVDFLEENQIINDEKAGKLKESFKSFKKNRNDIVHGDFFSPFVERKKAEECIVSVIDFYNRYEIDKI